MSITVGQPVTLSSSSVSTARGQRVALNQGRKGRVCKVYPGGQCCVQFGAPTGCRRMDQSRLQPAPEPAPACSNSCAAGCWP